MVGAEKRGSGEAETTGGRPAELAAIPGDRVVELDVRDDLRQGNEPFARIMAAKAEVPADGALMLRAIFEPAPLYAVLGKQGFLHWTEHRGDEDWVVWFYRPPSAGAEGAGAAGSDSAETPGGETLVGEDAAEGEPEAGNGVVVLDVRGMEPPEPMVRTLAALETLPRGETLVQINVREPRFLLPQLEERGYVYEVREQAEDLVRVFIRHSED